MAISPSPFDRIRNPRRGTSSHPLAWLGVVAVVVLVALVVMFRQQAAQAFWYVAAPVVRVREALGASEVATLKAQLASTTALLADRSALYKENIDLKERLGRSDTAHPRILAAVLMRPPGVPYDTLLIDAGQAQGVELGDTVSAGGSAIIGRIVEVYANQSRVELLSAPSASYQATLNGTLPVAVEGQGGGSMRAEVPAGTQVKVGDTVELPGIAGGIAAAVSAVDVKAGESFIVIYMRLPVNPAELQFVEVIKQQ
jgi:cell shape-determining protein MreC